VSFARRQAEVNASRLGRGVLGALLILVLSDAVQAAGLPVKTVDGKDSTLAASIAPGHWTVLMMWTTYCAVCRRQYPLISAFHDRHTGKDAEVLGVSLDGPTELPAVQAYLAKKPFSYPTVVADSDAMGKMFEAATGERFTGTPTYMVFNPERQLVAFKSGDIAPGTLDNYVKGTP
jgi:hypothetical protein